MRRFLLGILIILITLSFLLGVGLLLSEKKPETEPVASEATSTVPTEVTMETISSETQIPETVSTEPLAAEQPVFHTVPKYYQTDYPHIKFGNGTMATSGCSVTCLAMIATYLTDQEYTPVQMAYHFGSYGKNNIERLDYGISQMQLPYERTENIQVVLKALQQGKVAILMMDDESVFTNEQHFIVAAGITGDGKYIINDPFGYNYQDADVPVKNAYENGFEDYYLMRGFSGGWIFDKASMPEEPFLFDASVPQQQENRYNGYVLTDEDIYTLACFLWAEGRDASAEVQQAMAEVVLNRVVSPDYPNTLRDVIYKTEFYRAVNAMERLDEPDLTQYIAVDAAMYGPYILPENICFYSDWEKGTDIWGQLGNYTFSQKR